MILFHFRVLKVVGLICAVLLENENVLW